MRAAMRTGALLTLAMAMMLNVAAATDFSGLLPAINGFLAQGQQDDKGSPSPSADSKDPLVLGARTLPFFQPVKVPGEGDGKDDFINDGKDDFINGGKDKNKWQPDWAAAAAAAVGLAVTTITWAHPPRPFTTTTSPPFSLTPTVPTPTLPTPSITSPTLSSPSPLPPIPTTTPPLPPPPPRLPPPPPHTPPPPPPPRLPPPPPHTPPPPPLPAPLPLPPSSSAHLKIPASAPAAAPP
ncbi:hypothetical protein V8C86DRAFT_3132199 [Haematococcus lacustris]